MADWKCSKCGKNLPGAFDPEMHRLPMNETTHYNCEACNIRVCLKCSGAEIPPEGKYAAVSISCPQCGGKAERYSKPMVI